MSGKDLNYKLDLDNSSFTNKMSEAIDQTGKLDSSMSGMSKGGMMQAVVGGNLLTGAIKKAAGAVYDFGKDSLAAFGKQEQFLTSLKTMFHGNGVEAELLNDKLKNFAKTTPFELTEIQDATKMMVAYGSTSSSVVDEMKMLGDIGSGVGSSLSEIGYLYGTLRTQGRAYAMDIRQFTGRGIPIVKELAKQFGVTDDKVMKMVEDGKVGFKDVEKAFKGMTSEGGQFFGMMDNQSKTLDGQLSNMSDSFGQLKANVGGIFADLAKGVASAMSNIINTINATFDSIKSTQSRLKAGGSKEGFNPMSLSNLFNPMAVMRNVETSGLSNSMSTLVNVADRSEKDANAQKLVIYNQMKELNKSFVSGGVNKEDFFRQMAVMKGAQSEIDSRLAIKKKDSLAGAASSDKKTGGSASSQSKSLGTSAEISGAKPQSIVINITKLVEQLTLQTTNLTEGAAKIREEVAKALLEAVNDVNTLARTA